MNRDVFALIDSAMEGVVIVPCALCVGTGETLEGVCSDCNGSGATTTNQLEVGHNEAES